MTSAKSETNQTRKPTKAQATALRIAISQQRDHNRPVADFAATGTRRDVIERLIEAGWAAPGEHGIRSATVTEAGRLAVSEEVAPAARKPNFTVRKQSSGYAYSESYYVYSLGYEGRGKGRVSVGSMSQRQAQASADELNETFGFPVAGGR